MQFLVFFFYIISTITLLLLYILTFTWNSFILEDNVDDQNILDSIHNCTYFSVVVLHNIQRCATVIFVYSQARSSVPPKIPIMNLPYLFD